MVWLFILSQLVLAEHGLESEDAGEGRPMRKALGNQEGNEEGLL